MLHEEVDDATTEDEGDFDKLADKGILFQAGGSVRVVVEAEDLV